MKINDKLLNDMQSKSIVFDVDKFKQFEKERLQKIAQNSVNPNFKVRVLSEAQQQEFYQQKPQNMHQSVFDPFRTTQQGFQNRPGTAQTKRENKMVKSMHSDFFLQKEQNIFVRDFNNQFIQYITVERLEEYLGISQEYFENQRYVQIRFDSQETSIEIIGDLFPRLIELNLNNSCMEYLRDLGTGMQRIQVLHLARCGISDLSGINAFPELRELYLNFNHIAELNDLYFNDTLEVLDLEANNIDGDEQLEILDTISRLTNLTLENNPISKDKNYRKKVFQKLKQIKFLDDFESDYVNENLDMEDEQLDFQELYDKFPDIYQQEKQQVEREFCKSDPTERDLLMSNIFKNNVKVKNVNNDARRGALNFSEDNFYGNALKAIKHKKQNEISDIALVKDMNELYQTLQVNNFKPVNFDDILQIDESVCESDDIEYSQLDKIPLDSSFVEKKPLQPKKSDELDLGEKKPLEKMKIKISKRKISQNGQNIENIDINAKRDIITSPLDNIDMTASKKISELYTLDSQKSEFSHQKLKSGFPTSLKGSSMERSFRQDQNNNPNQTQSNQSFQIGKSIPSGQKPIRVRSQRGLTNPGFLNNISVQKDSDKPQQMQQTMQQPPNIPKNPMLQSSSNLKNQQSEMEKSQQQFQTIRQRYKNHSVFDIQGMDKIEKLEAIKPLAKISIRSQRANSSYRRDSLQSSENASTMMSSQLRQTQDQFNEKIDLLNDPQTQRSVTQFENINNQIASINKKQLDMNVRRFRSITKKADLK